MSNRPAKANLPGEMYQKNGRWWWKVRLPGEPRVRERALKPEGARFATKAHGVAERVAGEMWRCAIEAETEARVKAELKEQTNRKIARVTAKLTDKIDTCEKALSEAESKAKTEASLRIEAEQAARAHAEGLEKVAERTRRETKLRIEAEQKAKMEAQARSIAEARLQAETELRAEAEEKAASRVEACSPSKRRRGARDPVTPTKGGILGILRSGLRPTVTAENDGRTASCEGCGRDNVPENDLSRIESGQLVCPECMVVART